MENFWQYDYITDDLSVTFHIKLFIFIILLLLILLLIPVKHYKNFSCFTDENILYLNILESDFTYLEDKILYINNKSYSFNIIDYKDNIVKLELFDNIRDDVFMVTLKKGKVRVISLLLGRS